MLEVLDPGQNATFQDHYMDVPLDLSKVMFVCTSNIIDNIPGPLKDRMEIINLNGYDLNEKMEIALKYLIPKIKKSSGLMYDEDDFLKDGNNVVLASLKKKFTKLRCVDLKKKLGEYNLSKTGLKKALVKRLAGHEYKLQKDNIENITTEEEFNRNNNIPNVDFTKQGMEHLIRWYAREAGVRKLEQYIEKIYRKIAFDVVSTEQGVTDTKLLMDSEINCNKNVNNNILENISNKIFNKKKNDKNYVVDENNLHHYIGKERFTSDRLYEEPPPGVVAGLAYDGMGGCLLYIESYLIGKKINNNINNNTIDSYRSYQPPKLRLTGQLGDVMKER